MSDNVVLEHLRHIRAAVDRVEADIREVKHRIARLEEQTAGLHQDYAGLAVRLDRHDERLSRMERRFELVN